MKLLLCFFLLLASAKPIFAQKESINELKSELEKSPNSPLYVKQILKKRFKIDTIVVTRTAVFHSLADSIAYNGKEKKVYGPYMQNGARFLVQVLAKTNNLFYHISQIFIDTAVFNYKYADSLGNRILAKISDGSASFEDMAQTYSMGGEAVTKGDLGWVARGVLFPQIEKEVAKRKKGEIFKIWTTNALHIIKKIQEPKEVTGFALLMRVFL